MHKNLEFTVKVKADVDKIKPIAIAALKEELMGLVSHELERSYGISDIEFGYMEGGTTDAS